MVDDKMESGEKISAMVDGELDHHELGGLIAEMRDDGEMLQAWERYHLVSDVLKKNLCSHISTDFCQRISAALVNEPAILAPRRRNFHLTPLMRQIAGLGVAASVTAVAILGTQYYMNSGEMPAASLAAAGVETQMPASNNFERIALPQQQPFPSSVDKYMVYHNQHAAGVQGVLPYVRIIGYRPDSQEK